MPIYCLSSLDSDDPENRNVSDRTYAGHVCPNWIAIQVPVEYVVPDVCGGDIR
jgi:hypothetical protein